MVCAVYFTGANCPHCQKVKPVVEKIVNDTPNLVLIRYEIQEETANAAIFDNYGAQYGFELVIPTIFFSNGEVLQGDTPIISGLKNKVDALQSSSCPLMDGSSIAFENLYVDSLPGKPQLLLYGKSVVVNNTNSSNETHSELTFAKIVSLAAVDAINPCAFAVLILILVAILTANPEKKSKVLWSGFAFALAVFLTYFVYGSIIIIFFQAIKALNVVSLSFT